jgi:glucose-1-phosphate adenylyltransferase
VRIEANSQLQDTVVLPNVEIAGDCRLRRVVVDKGCRIPSGTIIGEDLEQDARRFSVTAGGIVLVTPEMLGQDIHHVR